MSDILIKYPALWIPLLGLSWTFIEIWWSAAKGRIVYSVPGAFVSIGYAIGMLVIMYQIGVTSWQWWVLFGYYILGVGMSVYHIGLGGKRDSWNAGEALLGSLIAWGVVALWFTGAPA